MSSPPSGPTVFVSYRRQDTRHLAGRLYDRLKERFGAGQVFMDVSSLGPGTDFRDAITSAVGSSDVLLVLIGTSWTDATDTSGGRRLDDPDDFVVLEIRTALERKVRVVPVLVDGAQVPRDDQLPAALVPLTRRHAVPIDHQTFESDTQALLDDIGSDHTPTPVRPDTVVRRLRHLGLFSAIAVLTAAIGYGVATLLPSPESFVATSRCQDLTTDFRSTVLDTRLTRANDAGGTETFELAGSSLIAHAPLGADARVDKQGQVTAPYLSLPASGDFVVEATLSADPTTGYQGAGLLLLTDQDNYVRLERGFGDFDAIAFEFARNGTHIKLNGPFNGDPSPVEVAADDVDLRLARTGGQVAASWRERGATEWQSLRTTAPLAGDPSVGITALNTGLASPTDATPDQSFDVVFHGLSLTCGAS